MANAHNKTLPKVAVCMVTYNHEMYIAQAIESIVTQKGDFDLVLYIGEDCSTDNTREICRKYEQKYPDIIKLIAYEVNQGIQKNFFHLLKKCKENADYVAFCDGDDFWTSEKKLAIQVAFLEQNAGYIGCFHNWNVVNASGELLQERCIKKTSTNVYTIRNAIAGWFAHINCMLLRSDAIPVPMPPYMYKTPVTDVCFYITVLDKGNLAYIDEVMCSYRKHGKGASVAMNAGHSMFSRRLKYLQMINIYYRHKYDYIIRKQVHYDSVELLKRLKVEDAASALLYLKASLHKYLFSRPPGIIEKMYNKVMALL